MNRFGGDSVKKIGSPITPDFSYLLFGESPFNPYLLL